MLMFVVSRLALARWRAPLRTLGAAPELCGDDGDGGGARTRTGGALGQWMARARWLRMALEGAVPSRGRRWHRSRLRETRTHARTHALTPHPHTRNCCC
jgi:hypothetical protein